MALAFNPHFGVPPHLKAPIPYPSIIKSSAVSQHRAISNSISNSRSINTKGNMNFTWDDVVRVSQPEYSPREDSSDLSGFFDKVKLCNRGSEKQKEFVPFLLEDQLVGYIHNGFVDHLRKFSSVFECHTSYVTLHEMLQTPDARTKAVVEVIQHIAEGGGGGKLIPGIRNELYPVTSSFGKPTFFSLERAAASYFGIKAYGVHMNGYVEKDGEKFLWLGKRSLTKPTYPGMLDHLVAGGLPHGISCRENMMKECEEEAGIPQSLASEAIPVGAVSYVDIDEYRYKRDVLFCYDLKLPQGFMPKNQDGEVEGFQLIPVSNVANIIHRTHYFKANCCLVIIDFLFRHGYVSPDSYGYLDLLQSLRNGDCS